MRGASRTAMLLPEQWVQAYERDRHNPLRGNDPLPLATCSACSFRLHCHRISLCRTSGNIARCLESTNHCRSAWICTRQHCLDSGSWPSAALRLGWNIHSGYLSVCAAKVSEPDDTEIRPLVVDLGGLERRCGVALASWGWHALLACGDCWVDCSATSGLWPRTIFAVV
jgi:hypothetical protein